MCAFFYEKKLYVLVNDELTNSKLYVADQNGQNRKEIGKLDYSVSVNARLIVKEGMAAALKRIKVMKIPAKLRRCRCW